MKITSFKSAGILLLTVFLFIGCKNKSLKTFENEKEMIQDAKSGIKSISLSDFKKAFDNQEKYYLVDCREEAEYDSSCIPGAINIPRGLLEFKIGNKIPERRAVIYVYCSNGDRSALAVEVLPKLKFSNAILIESGFDGWKAAYPDDIELEPGGDQKEESAPPPSGGGCGG